MRSNSRPTTDLDIADAVTLVDELADHVVRPQANSKWSWRGSLPTIVRRSSATWRGETRQRGLDWDIVITRPMTAGPTSL